MSDRTEVHIKSFAAPTTPEKIFGRYGRCLEFQLGPESFLSAVFPDVIFLKTGEAVWE
jgi:hypothetical protein